MVHPHTILESVDWATEHKIRLVERMLRAGARWIQSKLKNVHIDYVEEFGTEELKITLTIKMPELLNLITPEKQKDKKNIHRPPWYTS